MLHEAPDKTTTFKSSQVVTKKGKIGTIQKHLIILQRETNVLTLEISPTIEGGWIQPNLMAI